jgi:hypothetical protein
LAESAVPESVIAKRRLRLSNTGKRPGMPLKKRFVRHARPK